MYNRYMGKGFDELIPREFIEPECIEPEQFAAVGHTPTVQSAPGASNPLGALLGGVKLPEMNMDTLILVVLVYFLIAEEGESVGDTMLIIAVLLILGF